MDKKKNIKGDLVVGMLRGRSYDDVALCLDKYEMIGVLLKELDQEQKVGLLYFLFGYHHQNLNFLKTMEKRLKEIIEKD